MFRDVGESYTHHQLRLTPAGGSVRSDVSKTGWTLRTDDGGYRLQRCGGCGFSLSAAGPADSSMSAPWKFGWGAARSMGTGDYICVTLRGGAPWGLTLREGEGDTYRPLLVSQVCMRACVGGCFNTTWAGSCLSNLMLVRLQRWINSLMKVCGHVVEILEKFLFLQSLDSFFLRWEIQQENRKKQKNRDFKKSEIWWERAVCCCIFVRVGCVLVRDSSAPLYGQGHDRVWSSGQYDLFSVTKTFQARKQVQ